MKNKVIFVLLTVLNIYILIYQKNILVSIAVFAVYLIGIYFIFNKAKNNTENINHKIIASITHDLKNPAIAHITAIELLLKGNFGKLTDIQVSYLNDLLNSCHNMLDMLVNLLWLYKFDNKMTAVNFSEFSFQSLLKEVFNENKLLFNTRHNKFNINDNYNEITIKADKMHIKRIISNIITNAVTHGLENSLIEISIDIEENKLIFLVKNQGHYVSESLLKCIFDKNEVFNQTSDSLSTGLGLYLSNSLLRLNGGKFIYNSAPDGINTFGFSISALKVSQNSNDNELLNRNITI